MTSVDHVYIHSLKYMQKNVGSIHNSSDEEKRFHPHFGLVTARSFVFLSLVVLVYFGNMQNKNSIMCIFPGA